ncbi:protein phosphatase inhibitor 2-like isoform X2 [Ruditapes philippinarum]|uniref:protein phosphatase inhibitor 2-like isoform X2 n=1 Tax=Ruditapes philippinarum TaxID=129788 RepID=UPI00295B6274|nr:protein phosphatase inhibitor 2-like isoform X2 [Ruditapes philippinarum]
MASSEKRPRKGILKTSTSFDGNDHHPRNKEMTWDEMNIIATHHPPDKDYGHMKIDEPPTPYSKCSDLEDEDDETTGERRGSVSDKTKLDAKSLSSRLEDIEAPTRQRRVSTEEDDSSDEEDEELTEEDREHRKKFEQKRKIHYNEFQAVKLAKQLMEEEDDDDDEEDETGDNGSNTRESVQMQTDQSPGTDIDSTGEKLTSGVLKVSGSSASGVSG